MDGVGLGGWRWVWWLGLGWVVGAGVIDGTHKEEHRMLYERPEQRDPRITHSCPKIEK